MKKKLNLNELKVSSFVTTDEVKIKETVKGGVIGVMTAGCDKNTEKGKTRCKDTHACPSKLGLAICAYLTNQETACPCKIDGF